jgi:hypothetical protein
MGTLRVQQVLLKATNHDDAILLSTGSNLIVQQGGASTSTFRIARGNFASLRDGNSGLFGETDASNAYLGIVSGSNARRSIRFGFASDEASNTGFGTLCARSLQVTDPGLSNTYRTRVDSSDGSLVKQIFTNNSWQELSRENLSYARFSGTVTATNIMTSNLIMDTSTLTLSSIPNLPASQITSGAFSIGSFNSLLSTTSNLQVAGAASIGCNFSVAGPSTFVGDVTTSNGLSVASGSLSVAAGSATFNSNVSIFGPFAANGLSTLIGAVACSNTLSVAKSAMFNSNLSVTGPLVSSGLSTLVGAVTCSNGLNVASGAAAFNSNVSIAGPLIASGLSALIGPVTCSNGLNVASGAAAFNSNVSIAGPLVASGLSTLVGAVTCSNGLNVSGAATLKSSLTVNGNVGVGNLAPSARFQVSGGSALFDSNVTIASALSAGSASLGVLTCSSVYPTQSNAYDIGSSALPWRNATFAGSVTATTYVGLTRKYWNKYNLGLINETTGYHKIASMLTWVGANNSVLRVSGQFGGEASFAMLDLCISTRPSPPLSVTGSAYGNLAAAKAYGDIAVYYDSNAASYDVYLTSTKQFGSWDLSIEGSSGNSLLEPSSSNTAAPSGTLQTPSTLSSLFSITETSSNLMSMTTSIACSNLATTGTVTVAGTDPLFSNKDWAAWTPTADSNATLTTNYARFCSTNKRATVEFSVQLVFAVTAQTASISLPLGHVIKNTTSATQLYSKSTGSNVYTNTQGIVGSVVTFGNAFGSVVADSSTSKLIFQLSSFIPGTWSAIGIVSYELA